MASRASMDNVRAAPVGQNMAIIAIVCSCCSIQYCSNNDICSAVPPYCLSCATTCDEIVSRNVVRTVCDEVWWGIVATKYATARMRRYGGTHICATDVDASKYHCRHYTDTIPLAQYPYTVQPERHTHVVHGWSRATYCARICSCAITSAIRHGLVQIS